MSRTSTAMVLRLFFITVEFNGLYKCKITLNVKKGAMIGSNGKLFTLSCAVMYRRISGFGFKPFGEIGAVGESQSERNFFNGQICVK